ncbi:NACHT domain-containing protein [Pseudomonas tohonis]|uniref:NACHT domain-containing protein n=1 Tax=Pseudomonas tohonis TaxID=2725477 RepID=UPI001564632E|nr:pentapeptide repeat-containing protein [Pseudomonas tohonis]
MSRIEVIAEKLANLMDVKLFHIEKDLPAFLIETALWIFVDKEKASSITEAKENLNLSALKIPDQAAIVHIVLDNNDPSEPETTRLRLGFDGVKLKYALQRILDLPDTFFKNQEQMIQEALRPIEGLSGGAIKMRSRSTGPNPWSECSDAHNSIAAWTNASLSSNLLFVEAEAGKGKTILLASLAKNIFDTSTDKLSIYIPLRKLPLSTGISWENISQLIGVVGLGAERLAKAVKLGLVIIFLDGIDEVSGRYDNTLIRDLLELLTEKLSSQNSKVILSGRKSEARAIEKAIWTTISIELPSPESLEFERYINFTIEKLLEDWNYFSKSIPIEYQELLGNINADEKLEREIPEIANWIATVFPEVGKESSLFFIQGLAAIAIGRRAGNRLPLNLGKKLFIPTLMDVCIAAAIFACLREQKKIDDIAESAYTAPKQLEVLKGFALLASASNQRDLPTPNELTAKAFNVNTVHDPEIYVAINRQNAKHALLYSTEAVGNYRPQFLSDWIRCAFAARLLKENPSSLGISDDTVASTIFTSDRSRYLFSEFMPDILKGNSIPLLWREFLSGETWADSEHAVANIWQLRAAIGDENVTFNIPNPLPFAQLDHAEFSNCNINQELSGESFYLDNAIFSASTLNNVTLSGVSLEHVIFRDCQLSNITIKDRSTGPITFERCTLQNFKLIETTSTTAPAATFIDCDFEGLDNLISQPFPAHDSTSYEAFAVFQNCTTETPINKLLQGDWINLQRPIEGLKPFSAEVSDPSIECLRRTLAPFFPSRVGSSPDIQARRYIRLSALGRGRMPAKSPSPDELKSILESIGFADGGRSDHLYAPWASVLGGAEEERKIREDIINFLMHKDIESPTIQKLLRRISPYFV